MIAWPLFFIIIYCIYSVSFRSRVTGRSLRAGYEGCPLTISSFLPFLWEGEGGWAEQLKFILPTNHLACFTTAYFTKAADLQAEMLEGGFQHEQTLPIEGPAWLSHYVETNWDNESQHSLFLDFLNQIENVPELLGVSSHLMIIGRKK